ncbi:hypothetical protein PVK06_041579 [Gossypium arboreum]|uniref:Disease resistance protein winged helix domain-containing protein n=1 Tax=Gossypium arboreum TaxID=29729 RepID=A0ABR0NBE0_GOSAR|nr:hypothetical protein PVK06_041579 [Gossypium arboreum]
MKELGENMVKHCAGLPLAIVVLGGILATKNNSLNQWRKISDNVKSYLKRGKNQGPEDVLALSFDDLPPYLRPCFLYLSHFPEDYMIDVYRLIQLWVAEGIVSSKQEERDGGEIAEDVAESYLMELVERCMIQVRQRDVATLKVKTVQMHDLMRGLCLSKAKQENFVFIIDRSNASSLSMIRKVRRVSVHEFFFIQCIKSPNIRSLLFFNEFILEKELEKYLPLEVLKYFDEHEDEVWNPLLWILAISIGGFKLPSDIGNLIHLRFLSLKDLEFIWPKLPSSLGNLRSIDPRHFAHLLSGCTSIYKLNIVTGISELPDYHYFSSHLAYIKLKWYQSKKDPMPTLEKLPNLRIFEFEEIFEVNEIFCSAQGFPRLESLSLVELHRLEQWKVDERAMPSLQRLEIRGCENLKMLP